MRSGQDASGQTDAFGHGDVALTDEDGLLHLDVAVEQNQRFTLSGRPNDLPVSFVDGNKQIRNMALMHLQESIVNNAATNIFERVLANKYPQHRTLFKVLSWTERIAFASYMSYYASAQHFKQAERNRQMALQFGYR